jgi:uncharacterized cofD-like protein
MKRTVTVIGGGTGSFNVLTGLKSYAEDFLILSIVTMMDSGGDSGRLRDEFGVLPPGDARRVLVALSEETQLLRDLFSFRFSDPPLEGRSFGNLFFLALTKLLNSEREAIEAISRILKIRGRVIAVTWDHVHLYAELCDGAVVIGEGNIDVPKHDPSIPIRRVYLQPEAQANPEAVEAILKSDFVVLAPGNLFTSTIPNLLVKGIPEALQQTNASLIYIMNLMTRYGETDGYTASEHVKQIVHYSRGRVPDAVLVHKGEIPFGELISKYQAEKSYQVGIDIDHLSDMGVRVVTCRNVVPEAAFVRVRHDPDRTARALVELFGKLDSTRGR